MAETAILEKALSSICGIDEAAFSLSLPHWELKTYKKGEFYNEYRNVCKHLGFILDGVFRTYYVNTETGEEKNLLFFSSSTLPAHRRCPPKKPPAVKRAGTTASQIPSSTSLFEYLLLIIF